MNTASTTIKNHRVSSAKANTNIVHLDISNVSILFRVAVELVDK